jgi:maltose O-acetyltransferase
MLKNEWYLDEPDLVEDRRRCWRLLDRFNATLADEDAERQDILKQLVGQLGDDAVIMPRFQCSYGAQISLGARSFVNHDALFMDDAEIIIGEDVRIGPRTQLLTALHPVEDHSLRREGWERTLPVSIGPNAWLGAGVIVCPGVSIGEDAVVGAGSVVTRDVPHTFSLLATPRRSSAGSDAIDKGGTMIWSPATRLRPGTDALHAPPGLRLPQTPGELPEAPEAKAVFQLRDGPIRRHSRGPGDQPEAAAPGHAAKPP